MTLDRMITKVVEYEIDEDDLMEVLSAIKDFTKSIKKNEPDTVYEAYRKKDSNKFIHLMKFKDKSAESKHQKATYTNRFVDIIYPKCKVKPKFTDLTNV